MPDGITKCLLASRACFARRRTVLRCEQMLLIPLRFETSAP